MVAAAIGRTAKAKQAVNVAVTKLCRVMTVEDIARSAHSDGFGP